MASLLPGGSARRDEAHHFVRALFPNGVGHEQENHSSSQTERPPARLPRFGDKVLLEQGAGVFEDVHGVLEHDAVFPCVGTRFHRVPLEPHHPDTIIPPNL